MAQIRLGLTMVKATLQIKESADEITTLDGEVHSKEEIISKMDDDDFYYGYLTKNALSCSLLKMLMKSPKHYLEITQGEEQNETQALRDGKLIHWAVLEPEKFAALPVVDVKSKNSKAYKEAVAQLGTVYTITEIEKAEKMAAVIHANSEASEYLKDAQFEIPEIAMIDGIAFRAKADILKGKQIIDLKTTIDVKKFKWSAYKYGYDLQAYLYLQMFPEAESFTFLCIDKGTQDIAVFECSEEFLESGKKKLEAGIREFNFFFPEGEDNIDINNYVYRDIL